MTIKHFLKIAIVFSSRKKKKEGKKKESTVSQKYTYIYIKITSGKKDTCHMITSYYQENKNYK